MLGEDTTKGVVGGEELLIEEGGHKAAYDESAQLELDAPIIREEHHRLDEKESPIKTAVDKQEKTVNLVENATPATPISTEQVQNLLKLGDERMINGTPASKGPSMLI